MSDDMGVFRTTVRIANLKDRVRSATLDAVLVDTGAELTWVPATVLQELGVSPEKKLRFRLANGHLVERDIGYAFVSASGSETVDEVVFGRPGDLTLLGARSLEGLNLRVDLANKELVSAGPMLV